MRFSLKLKLIILMVVVLGATILVSYLILNQSEEELLRQVVQHVKSVEDFGNVVEIQQLLKTDLNRIVQHQLQVSVGQGGRIAQISLLDATRKVISSSIPEDVGLTLTELEQRRVKGTSGSFWDTLLKKHIKKYDITFPIFENGRERGYINVVLVMNDLEYLIKKAKYSNIFWITTIFVVGTLVAIFLVNRFTRPVDHLVAASKAVADGNFDTTVQMRSGDELDTLITGFNEMTHKLKEHKALEERVHRSERMAELGELGARLAHEIRNPLNSINLIIDHIKDRFSPVEDQSLHKFEDYVTNIKTELKRLNKLVSDFLQVSRPLHPDLRPMPVKPFLQQIQQLLETEARNHQIQFEIEVAPEDLCLQGDEGLLKTACLNIALNAIQAMEQGGQLRIAARLFQDGANAQQAGQPDVNTARCVISFADTGPGIAPEIQEKIFQPYFTTKKEGTGLGLAIVNRVIEDHFGSIQVESQNGHGTTITLLLPLA